jgi:hypothetical protein
MHMRRRWPGGIVRVWRRVSRARSHRLAPPSPPRHAFQKTLLATVPRARAWSRSNKQPIHYPSIDLPRQQCVVAISYYAFPVPPLNCTHAAWIVQLLRAAATVRRRWSRCLRSANDHCRSSTRTCRSQGRAASGASMRQLKPPAVGTIVHAVRAHERRGSPLYKRANNSRRYAETARPPCRAKHPHMQHIQSTPLARPTASPLTQSLA